MPYGTYTVHSTYIFFVPVLRIPVLGEAHSTHCATYLKPVDTTVPSTIVTWKKSGKFPSDIGIFPRTIGIKLVAGVCRMVRTRYILHTFFLEERRRRPLPPENHDSARAGGPYATKAILQEEGSGHHGGHDQQ